MANSAQKQATQETGNLGLWEFMRGVPESARRRIQGGHLNGKTDINPVWRIKMLTEAFGVCGFGWNVKEVDRWTNECAGEVGAFVKVELRIRMGDAWSEPIEGTGGSKLCGKGRGEGINDEAWKMATTDAISVACKSLGMAADIYYEKDATWGSKYETREMPQGAPRSSAPGNYAAQPQRGRQAPRNAAPAPAAAPAPGTPAQLPPQGADQRVHIILATVTTGRCRRIVSALASRDYDDPADWAAGKAAICERYFVDDDALREIERLAVVERDAMLQQQIDNVRK